jgi:hypothetical protein
LPLTHPFTMISVYDGLSDVHPRTPRGASDVDARQAHNRRRRDARKGPRRREQREEARALRVVRRLNRA